MNEKKERKKERHQESAQKTIILSGDSYPVYTHIGVVNLSVEIRVVFG